MRIKQLDIDEYAVYLDLVEITTLQEAFQHFTEDLNEEEISDIILEIINYKLND